ncbi:MAG: hypothetical protein KDM63_03110, partial [Verrucomicrobiae bacterium]|nr:hypothetical protein [Verrucomicrobiae bacterium]
MSIPSWMLAVEATLTVWVLPVTVPAVIKAERLTVAEVRETDPAPTLMAPFTAMVSPASVPVLIVSEVLAWKPEALVTV